jgi:transcriptional regulator with XRE-family HTH domain
MVELKDKILEIRKLKNFSVADFATFLGVSRQAVYDWESGETKPSKNRLKDIAKKLDIDVNFFTNDNISVNLTTKVPVNNNVMESLKVAIGKLEGYVIGKYGKEEWRNIQEFFPNFNMAGGYSLLIA